MGITKENGWRNKTIFASVALMLVCLFVSRAALSVSMMFFFALTLVHKNFFQQLRVFSNNIFLLSISWLFFIPFISGLWSSDLQEWSEMIRIKLPLLLFPISFAGSWKLSEAQWKNIAVIFLVLIFLGCCWSLIHYFENAGEVHKNYLKAKTITTPLEDDHIRFSWLVSVAITSCFLLRQKVQQKNWQIALISLAVFFAIYLHILAARMGLFCFYLSLLFFGVWGLFKNRSKKGSLIVLTTLLLLPVLAWFSLPTFQNRIRYLIYDISNVRSHVYVPGSNDGARVLSLKAGCEIVKQNPFGTGAGDLYATVNEWYTTNAPNLKEKFLPCSEVLVYGGFGGWIGIALLIFILLVPFFEKVKRHTIFWYSLNAIVVFSFVFDMTIEAQFGVFIYGAILLWWWKWLNQPGTHE